MEGKEILLLIVVGWTAIMNTYLIIHEIKDEIYCRKRRKRNTT